MSAISNHKPAPAPAKPAAPAPKPAAPKAAQAQQARQQEAPQSKPQTKSATPPANDKVVRSEESHSNSLVSQERSEQFAGFADNFGDASVTVQPWGTGQNDSVWGSLRGQGFTDEQIVEQGLVDQVAQANDLKDPNVVNPGQQLSVPTLTPPAETAETAGTEAAQEPKPPAMNAQELDKDSDPQALQQRDYASTFNQNFAQFDSAADQDGKTDGRVSSADLRAIADGTVYADEKTRAAAEYYLGNPGAMLSLDQAGASEGDKGKGDNLIVQSDAEANLNAANQSVRDTGRTEAERQAYDANKSRVHDNSLASLEQNFDQIAGPDGKFKKDELNRLAQDATADPQMREAAQFLIDNPDRLNRLDGAGAHDQGTDGTIAMHDLKQARTDTFNDLRKNPDAQRSAEVEQQQGRQWDSPQAALQNLQENPDLSSYSQEQLASLALLSQSDPAARDQIAAATGNYVNDHTNSLDDVPEDQMFQALLSQEVVSPENLDHLSEETRGRVEEARRNLQSHVNTELVNTINGHLEGKQGDAGAALATAQFAHDVKGLAEKNPALVPYFQTGSQELGKNPEVGDRLQDVKQADDGPLGHATDWLGDTLASGLTEAGNQLGDVLKTSFKYFPTNLPITMAAEGLEGLGIKQPKQYWEEFTSGALDRTTETIVGGFGDTLGGLIENPTDTLDGLYNLTPTSALNDLITGKSPSEVLEEKASLAGGLWDSVTGDYATSIEKHGVVGGLSHIASDIALTVATGGGSKLPKLGDFPITGKAGDLTSGLNDVYGKLTGGLGDVTENMLGNTRLPGWAQDIAATTVGNGQGSVTQNADDGAFTQNPFAPVAEYFSQAQDRLGDFFKGLGIGQAP